MKALKTTGEPAQPPRKRITGKANPAALFGGMATKNQNTGTDAKAKAKAKAKSKSPKNAKAKSTSSQATTSKSTTPPGVRPALDIENIVYYGGGKLYAYPKRKQFRVWLRLEDKKDKGVRYGHDPSPAHLKDKWEEALRLIENDPRPADVD